MEIGLLLSLLGLGIVIPREIRARREIAVLTAACEEIREREARLHLFVRSSSDIVAILAPDRSIRDLSPVVERLLGYSPESLVGRSVFELVHPHDLPRARALVEDAYAHPGASGSTELRMQRKDGSWCDFFVAVDHPIADPQVQGIVITYRDIVDRKKLEETLSQQLLHDSLVRLPNGILFLDRLRRALVGTSLRKRQLAVLCLDLDLFGNVNSELGWAAGDLLLQEVARRLQACVRPDDTLARLVDDSFALLLEDLDDVSEAVQVARRIAGVLGRPFRLEGHEIHLTASIGVAASTDTRLGADTLLHEAELACRHAQANGTAGFAVFDESLQNGGAERRALEQDLRDALDRAEFRLRYQPVVDLETGTIREIEALVRWEHPRRGLIAPPQFLPLTEEMGLILPLGAWVLEEACRQAGIWHRQHPAAPPPVVSVNVSMPQLRDPGWVYEVSRTLRRSGLDPSFLQFEFPERILISPPEDTLSILHSLKDRGVHLAIDDFGSGHTSVGYLSRFPFDVLKLDGRFVKDLAWSPASAAFIETVVPTAHALKIRVTAKEIEAECQQIRLRECGCDRGQGRFFSGPVTGDVMSRLLGGEGIPFPPATRIEPDWSKEVRLAS